MDDQPRAAAQGAPSGARRSGLAYAPLEVRGAAAARAVGFLRGGDIAVVVPIRTWAPQWADTQVRLPDGRWDHVLTDVTIDGGAADLEALFDAFPVALLERRTG